MLIIELTARKKAIINPNKKKINNKVVEDMLLNLK